MVAAKVMGVGDDMIQTPVPAVAVSATGAMAHLMQGVSVTTPIRIVTIFPAKIRRAGEEGGVILA